MSIPLISLVVVIYDMAREAPRTLRSLSLSYQREIEAGTYEVIVVDNGSPQPLGKEVVRFYGDQFSYAYEPPGNPSPVAAVNRGLARARGRILGVMVDGARLTTPGLLHHVELASRLHPRPIIAVPGWHLGPDLQSKSALEGYDKRVEDGLLEGVGWPEDGYRLFDISTLAASNPAGWFMPWAESNAIFLERSMLDELGGFDEAFRSPGGGLCNLDYFVRACELDAVQLVVLLGEGTFHQIHGGTTTQLRQQNPWDALHAEYQQLRRRPFRMPEISRLYLGQLPPSSLRFIEWSAAKARGEERPLPEAES